MAISAPKAPKPTHILSGISLFLTSMMAARASIATHAVIRSSRSIVQDPPFRTCLATSHPTLLAPFDRAGLLLFTLRSRSLTLVPVKVGCLCLLDCLPSRFQHLQVGYKATATYCSSYQS